MMTRLFNPVNGGSGVLEEFQSDEHSYLVKMRVDGEPDVEVRDGRGGLVWESVGKTPRRHRGKVVQGPWRTRGSSSGP